jgi:hypothetical protein
MKPAFQRFGPVWALESSIWASSPPRIRLGLSEGRLRCSNLSAKRAYGAADNWPPPRDRRASPNPVRLGRTFANWPRPAARVTLRAAFGATICVPVAQRIERPPSKRQVVGSSPTGDAKPQFRMRGRAPSVERGDSAARCVRRGRNERDAAPRCGGGVAGLGRACHDHDADLGHVVYGVSDALAALAGVFHAAVGHVIDAVGWDVVDDDATDL